jgi:DNA-binding CsgD family transcriptional regulator
MAAEYRYMALLVRIAAALALDQHDLMTAQAWLEAHDRWQAWSGVALWRAEGELLWARYERLLDHFPQASQRAERALAYASAPRQPLALLAAHRLLGELDTEAGHHAAAREHLDASLALAAACHAPWERALTLLALAEYHAATARARDARAALDEVRAICMPLGAQPSLNRADALAARLTTASTRGTYPAGLTEREVEVLRLVAQGLTNARVGERLFISPRTVDFHLRSIYGKLGVTTRAAATRFVLEHNFY